MLQHSLQGLPYSPPLLLSPGPQAQPPHLGLGQGGLQHTGGEQEDQPFLGQQLQPLPQHHHVLGHVVPGVGCEGESVPSLGGHRGQATEQRQGSVWGEAGLQLGMAVQHQAGHPEQGGDGQQLWQAALATVGLPAVHEVDEHQEGLIAEEGEPDRDGAWLLVLLRVSAHQLHELAGSLPLSEQSAPPHSRVPELALASSCIASLL